MKKATREVRKDQSNMFTVLQQGLESIRAVNAFGQQDFEETIPLNRNVKSVFGELVVPIFGADNATTLLQELTVSAAGRYDDYSDVGSTFNPKFGLTWRPIDWLKLRAAYGESFNAPSLADGPTADLTTVFLLPGSLPEVALRVPSGPYPVPTAAQTHTVAVRGNMKF